MGPPRRSRVGSPPPAESPARSGSQADGAGRLSLGGESWLPGGKGSGNGSGGGGSGSEQGDAPPPRQAAQAPRGDLGQAMYVMLRELLHNVPVVGVGEPEAGGCRVFAFAPLGISICYSEAEVAQYRAPPSVVATALATQRPAALAAVLAALCSAAWRVNLSGAVGIVSDHTLTDADGALVAYTVRLHGGATAMVPPEQLFGGALGINPVPPAEVCRSRAALEWLANVSAAGSEEEAEAGLQAEPRAASERAKRQREAVSDPAHCIAVMREAGGARLVALSSELGDVATEGVARLRAAYAALLAAAQDGATTEIERAELTIRWRAVCFFGARHACGRLAFVPLPC